MFDPSGPLSAATEDVRDDFASSAGSEQRPGREVQRGGVDDRDPARTARRRARGAQAKAEGETRAV